jgi:hypothetical protein
MDSLHSNSSLNVILLFFDRPLTASTPLPGVCDLFLDAMASLAGTHIHHHLRIDHTVIFHGNIEVKVKCFQYMCGLIL